MSKRTCIGRTSVFVAGFIGMACMAAVFMTGCESGDSSDGSSTPSAVTVSPSSVYLDATKVSIVEFTASGGDSNYTWSLSDSSFGTLHAANQTALACKVCAT